MGPGAPDKFPDDQGQGEQDRKQAQPAPDPSPGPRENIRLVRGFHVPAGRAAIGRPGRAMDGPEIGRTNRQ